MVEVVLIGIMAVLWRLGGWGREDGNPVPWSGWRDVLVPFIMMIYFGVTAGWWPGFLTGGMANTIRIGYGSWDPEHDDKPSFLAKLTRDREGWRIRMIYGLITSLAIGFFVIDDPVKYFVYVFINVAGEGILTKQKVFNVWVTEPLTGALKGLVFLCR